MNLKEMKSNKVDELCPLCNRNLKYKPPCCSEKNSYLVCTCGYKKPYHDKHEPRQ